MLRSKEAKCKGIGKANGVIGCGKPSQFRRYGLCPSCLAEFLTETDSGKLIMQKSLIPKAKSKIKADRKEADKKAKDKVTNWGVKLCEKLQEIARKIDHGQPCTARGKIGGQMHGGHVLSKGSYPAAKFNLHNIHIQSAQSNHFGNEDALLREGIAKTYGQEYLDYILSLRLLPPLKLKNEELHSLYKIACIESNNIERTERTKSERLRLRNEINGKLGIYDPHHHRQEPKHN